MQPMADLGAAPDWVPQAPPEPEAEAATDAAEAPAEAEVNA